MSPSLFLSFLLEGPVTCFPSPLSLRNLHQNPGQPASLSCPVFLDGEGAYAWGHMLPTPQPQIPINQHSTTIKIRNSGSNQRHVPCRGADTEGFIGECDCRRGGDRMKVTPEPWAALLAIVPGLPRRRGCARVELCQGSGFADSRLRSGYGASVRASAVHFRVEDSVWSVQRRVRSPCTGVLS